MRFRRCNSCLQIQSININHFCDFSDFSRINYTSEMAASVSTAEAELAELVMPSEPDSNVAQAPESPMTPADESEKSDNWELEEVFTCAVCFELIVMPTTLNCGHTFCRHCLAQWFEVGQKTECPTCREVGHELIDAFLGRFRHISVVSLSI